VFPGGSGEASVVVTSPDGEARTYTADLGAPTE
jgi:hypothetical protein